VARRPVAGDRLRETGASCGFQFKVEADVETSLGAADREAALLDKLPARGPAADRGSALLAAAADVETSLGAADREAALLDKLPARGPAADRGSALLAAAAGTRVSATLSYHTRKGGQRDALFG